MVILLALASRSIWLLMPPSTKFWLSASRRPRIQSLIALGCSKISLSIKCSNPPFSIVSNMMSSFWIAGIRGTSLMLFIDSWLSCMTAISWSLMKTTWSVYSTMGVASEAIKNSSFPIPITIGLPLQAAMSVLGRSSERITRA